MNRDGEHVAVYKSLYVNGKSGQKANGKSGHCEHWNRLPDSVLCDVELTLAARCVYAFIAGATRQGTTAKVGQRRIGKMLGLHQETVSLAVKELAARGHLTIIGTGKERRIYHLHSDVFGQKQRALDAGDAAIEELVSAPRRRLATARKTA